MTNPGFCRVNSLTDHRECCWANKENQKPPDQQVQVAPSATNFLRRMSDTDPGNAEMYLVNPRDLFIEPDSTTTVDMISDEFLAFCNGIQHQSELKDKVHLQS